VDRPDEIGKRTQIVGSHERFPREDRGKAVDLGRVNSSGFGHELVETRERRDEGGTPAVHALTLDRCSTPASSREL
jgi:hypothetical protein